MHDRFIADISGKPRRLEEFNKDDFTPEPPVAPREIRTLIRQQVQDVLSSLTQRERQILGFHFGLDDGKTRTFRHIGQRMGFSQSTARRAERSALNKLRHPRG